MNWFQKVATKLEKVSAGIKSDVAVTKEKQQMKKARVKPRGYFMRKLGVALFWFAFFFMLFVIGNSLLAPDNVESEEDTGSEAVKVTSIEATEFAKRFAKAFYTWEPSEHVNTEREEQLAPFLGKNVEPFAGLDITGAMWKSAVRAVEVKEIKAISDETAHITLRVSQLVTETHKQDDTATAMVEISKEEQETEEVIKYVVVPVAYAGDQFFVYANPMFTYVNEGVTKGSVAYQDLKEAPIEMVQEITAFLPTFFKAYTVDSQEQLNYLLKEDRLVTGLNNSMVFEEVVSTKVYVGTNGSWLTFATVKLTDPTTKLQTKTTYQLEIVKEASQLVVSGFNNYGNMNVLID